MSFLRCAFKSTLLSLKTDAEASLDQTSRNTPRIDGQKLVRLPLVSAFDPYGEPTAYIVRTEDTTHSPSS